MPVSDDAPKVKVALRDADGDVETLWADDLGAGRYRLDNVPFFTRGVSLGDIVTATPNAQGLPEITGVVEKSGNRTLWVLFPEPIDRTHPFLAFVEAAGCSYEGARASLFAVNVPPHVELERVVRYVEDETPDEVRYDYGDPSDGDDAGPDEA